MEPVEHILEGLEQDPELAAVKERLLELESELRKHVTDETWTLLLTWESEWAHYITLCAKRLYPIAYNRGQQDALRR